MGKVQVHQVYCLCCPRRSGWHLRSPPNRNVFSVEGMRRLFHLVQRASRLTMTRTRRRRRNRIYSPRTQ